MKYLLRICALFILYLVGVLLFTKGFLLKRTVLSANNTCSVDFADVTTGGCWLEPRFRRAVMIVIDALRFDFVAADNSTDLPAYRNKLTSLSRASRDLPYNARMFRFIADPPTTTLQRLKGLTTGSLPTFVDAGSNFASTEITEDNIIDQLWRQGRNITFLGDDTWQALFPRRFHRSFPFPSFNVKDLDTVDNGILEHLFVELKKPDWNILIAHFLGVDHCGHTFGPQHPTMAAKLTQMDSMLQSVMSELSNDTILFVFGDHGMSPTGDHGGDSDNELNAALFVYSPANITQSPSQHNQLQKVYQVDLVPTLALLLGVPIPLSNLGTVITDLFDYSPTHTAGTSLTHNFHKVKALHLNANQVRRYIDAYSKTSDDLGQIDLDALDEKFSRAELNWQQVLTTMSDASGSSYLVNEKLQELHVEYIEYLTGVRNLCRSVWSKFDLVAMFMGGITVVCAFAVNITMATVLPVSFPLLITISTSSILLILSGLASIFQLSWEFFGTNIIHVITTLFGTILLAAVLGSLFINHKLIFSQFEQFNAVSLMLGVLQATSLLSNSFIVYEDHVVQFILQSMVIALVVSYLCQQAASMSEHRSRNKHTFHWSSVGAVVLYAAIFSMCLRLSGFFHVCREEQLQCYPTVFAQSLSAVLSEYTQFRNFRFVISVVSVISVICSVTAWLRYYGNMNGNGPLVIMMSYAIPAIGMFLPIYWVFDGLLTSGISRTVADSAKLSLPRLIYMLSSATVATAAVWPLTVYVLPRSGQERKADTSLLTRMPEVHQMLSPQEVVPQIYNHIRTNWRSVLTTQTSTSAQLPSNPPLVYGLATVYSASHLVLWVVIAMAMMLLLGDNMAPSVALLAIALFCVLELHTSQLQSLQGNDHGNQPVRWSSIVLVWFLASERFFSTGHQATIAGIRWEAAFHGFHGNHETVWLPALLVSLNTFSGHILCTLALPLLVYWPFKRGRSKVAGSETEYKGEFVLNEDGGKQLKHTLFVLFIKFIMLSALKVMLLMCCVSVHRRHLMVWKIFAPRFVYEATIFLILSLVCIFTYLFVARLNHSLSNWVRALCRATTG